MMQDVHIGEEKRINSGAYTNEKYRNFADKLVKLKYTQVYHQPNPDGTYTDVKYDNREWEERWDETRLRPYLTYIGTKPWDITLPEGLTHAYRLLEDHKNDELPSLLYNANKGWNQLLSCEDPFGHPAQNETEKFFLEEMDDLLINNRKIHEFRAAVSAKKFGDLSHIYQGNLEMKFLNNGSDFSSGRMYACFLISPDRDILAVAADTDHNISVAYLSYLKDDFHFYPVKEYIRCLLPDPLGYTMNEYMDRAHIALRDFKRFITENKNYQFPCTIEDIAENEWKKAYIDQFLEEYPKYREDETVLCNIDCEDVEASDGSHFVFITDLTDLDGPLAVWNDEEDWFMSEKELKALITEKPEEPELT